MLDSKTLYQFAARMLRTHVFIFPAGDEQPLLYTHRLDLEDTFLTDPDRRRALRAINCGPLPLVIRVGDAGLHYGLIHAQGTDCILGPVISKDDYDLKYTLPWDEPDPVLLQQAPLCALAHFIEYLLLLAASFHEETISMETCLQQNSNTDSREMMLKAELSRQLYNSRETQTSHNSYAHEQRELYAIESGSLELLEASWKEQYSGKMGVTSQDMARNGRNLSMIAVALAVRAAIRGGVLPDAAMTMGDIYMRQIDSTPNLYELVNITHTAQTALTKMVLEAKQQAANAEISGENPLTIRCRHYIHANLHSRLTVQEIADTLGVHPNYLSKVFLEHTGTPLYQYILTEKINLAKNLLVYTQSDISDIATTIGFSSQSHMGTVFRRQTGMTPAQYRKQYGNQTFTI